jgi:hypothetical protein
LKGVGEVAELGFAADVLEQQSEAVRVGGCRGAKGVDGDLGEPCTVPNLLAPC